MAQRTTIFGVRPGTLGLPLLLLLAGCGDDRPSYQPIPSAPRVAAQPPPTAPLGAAPASTPDPLVASDPLAATDPLTSSHDDDPLNGQAKMPTDHSHWLRGGIFNARVQVQLNGMRLGEFSAPVDKDITMRCRSGLNTLTLTYTPLNATSSAHLDVLESEHDPPIGPLATYRSALATLAQPSHAETKTLTFIAR